VAFKVPYLECKEASHHEQHVLGHMRRDLCNVVQLLGIGRGSSAGEVVQGLVFEYCPGGDLAEWAVKLLQQAAQEPTMQQTHPLMAAAAASLSGTSWRPPKEWEVQMSAMDEHEQLPFIAAYLRPLREQVLEAPLKQHMRQLLRLVVKLSGSSSDSSTSSGAGGNGHSGRSGDDGGGSGSSSRGGDGSSTGGWGRGSGSRYPVTTTSATVPAGGLVINFDIKPSNIFLTADGTPKLGDWNVAMYVPDATLHQPFAPKGFTQR
jgi:serine/threonine protein kinase